MVAKSFKDFEILCEPYEISKKMYVRVRNPRTKTERQVRWYSEDEYYKLYPEEKETVKVHDIYYKPQKDVLGFANGFIYIFDRDINEEDELFNWFRMYCRRCTRFWGWYFPGTETLPDNLPTEVNVIKLKWEEVGNDDGKLKPEDKVIAAVDAARYPADNSSSHVGSIGERLDLTLTVISAIKIENSYGVGTLHTFEDTCGNQYTWMTNAKSWEPGTIRKIRGTVKAHSTYKGKPQTILTRCSEIKS